MWNSIDKYDKWNANNYVVIVVEMLPLQVEPEQLVQLESCLSYRVRQDYPNFLSPDHLIDLIQLKHQYFQPDLKTKNGLMFNFSNELNSHLQCSTCNDDEHFIQFIPLNLSARVNQTFYAHQIRKIDLKKKSKFEN